MEIRSKFEFFRKNNLVYLDSAATTQVPDIVSRAVEQALSFRGNPSRSSHVVAHKAEELLDEARDNIARFIGANASEIIFTNNATDSIHLAVDAIASHVQDGDELLISVAEHNSNLLPYTKLVKRGAKIRLIGMQDGVISADEVRSMMTRRTKIVAIGHCSNVLGNINDVEAIGRIVKEGNSSAFYIVDGTQAVAHIPVNVKPMNVDFYAFSGHKMYGPDGVGVLYASSDIHHKLAPVRAGGGSVRDVAVTHQRDGDIVSPEYLQTLSILEGGTPNTSNIVGLSKAVNFIRSIGFDTIRHHDLALLSKFRHGLLEVADATFFGPTDHAKKIGLQAFVLSGYSTKELSEHLSRQKICVRYGAHCAFPLTEALGQESLRVSFGVYNTEEDIDQVIGEIKFFLDKKRGLITNPNLEPLRNKIYYRTSHIVNSSNAIIDKVSQGLYDPQDTEIVVMGGHFLGIPDLEGNVFWPGIGGLLPERLHGLMEEFGMTSFPLYTWKLACRTVAAMKARGYKARLSIIANDTTGINELRLSKANTNQKTAEAYRDELLKTFGSESGLPESYLKELANNGLTREDVVLQGADTYYRETLLRANFKKFISGNKKYFDGVINYSAESGDNIDLSINLLDNQEIKTCTFDTFNSKTGGKFCIVELCQYIAELFGKADLVSFEYLSRRVLEPRVRVRHKVLVVFTPAMCDNAVTRAAELYTKLFLQEQGEGSFKFFNIPLGPNAERSLAIGAELTYISDKDSLEILEVDQVPAFPGLWLLNEYKLLYNADDYVDEMERLFAKIGITKNSNILDTCVGPGFFATELLQRDYNLATADGDEAMITPFSEKLKELGIEHQTTIAKWRDLGEHFDREAFELLINRGNSFIYAAGGWHEMVSIDRESSLEALRSTLRVYYELLKPGGYLYLDKFRDSEIPDKKVAARLRVRDTGEQKDIVFYVERKPEQEVRVAQMLLRNADGSEQGLPNIAYDLSGEELESLLRQVGFTFERLSLKTERHFSVWLAKKPL